MKQKWKTHFRLGSLIMSVVAVCCLYQIQDPFSESAVNFRNIGAACGSIVCLILGLIMRDISQLNPADSHSLKSLLVQYVIQKLIQSRAKKALHALQTATKSVAYSQHTTLENILQKAADTEYGRRYGFKEIKTREEFVEKVPLSKYDNYESYVQRLISDRRECDGKLLTQERVEYIAKTSGTTDKNKLLPMTRQYKDLITRVFGPLAVFNELNKTNFTLGRVLSLSYDYKKEYTPSGLTIGTLSSYIGRVYSFALTPSNVSEITDELVAMHLHAVFGLMDPYVERINAAFSPLLYTFWRHIECHWQKICDEIESGTLNLTFQNKSLVDLVGKDSAEAIERELKRRSNSKRADQLREEFSQGFINIAKRIWPRLKCATMVNTGSYIHYSAILKDIYMADVIQISNPHVATEGLFGIHLSFNGEGEFTLLTQMGFFEFIPEVNIADENPRTLFAHELEPGGLYEIVYTSPMGLYRYRIGDVIRIVSKIGQCPVYKFEYRTGQILNVYWEKLPESVLYRCIQEFVNRLGPVQLVDYTTTESLFVPQLSSTETFKKFYVLFLELNREGGDVLLKEEEKLLFDEILRGNYELYELFRGNSSIGPVYVIQVKCGTFGELRRLTAKGVQHKLPRVTRRQEDIEFLISNRIPPKLL